MTSVTIIKDRVNRHFTSFVVEANPKCLDSTNNSIDIDFGISNFTTLWIVEKIVAPKLLKDNLKKLDKFQHQLSPKSRGYRIYKIPQFIPAKFYTIVKDVISDLLYKLSSKYYNIMLENSNLSGPIKNHNFSLIPSEGGAIGVEI